MGDLTFEESNEWRVCIKRELCNYTKDIGLNVNIINPNDYYNFIKKSHETEYEVRQFDLNLVRRSDLIIVNFNDPHSIGTSQELAIANEHRIPVIGLNESQVVLPPWLKLSCDRIFNKKIELLDYVKWFYFN